MQSQMHKRFSRGSGAPFTIFSVCVYVCVIILICNTTEVVVGFLAFANTNSGRICNVTPY